MSIPVVEQYDEIIRNAGFNITLTADNIKIFYGECCCSRINLKS